MPDGCIFTEIIDTTKKIGTPILPCLFTFNDDDDPGPLPIDWVCLELEFGPKVGDTFERFEIDDDAAAIAAAFATAALSTLFKNELGKFSSSVKSYSGEGWLPGTLGLEGTWQWQPPQRDWSYCPMVLEAASGLLI